MSPYVRAPLRSLVKFKQRLRTRGYPKTIIERSLPGVNFASRPSALTQKKKANERILPFVTSYHAAVSNLKQILMKQWSLIQDQPLLKTICLKPSTIFYKRGKSLKDTLVRSKVYARRPPKVQEESGQAWLTYSLILAHLNSQSRLNKILRVAFDWLKW